LGGLHENSLLSSGARSRGGKRKEEGSRGIIDRALIKRDCGEEVERGKARENVQGGDKVPEPPREER